MYINQRVRPHSSIAGMSRAHIDFSRIADGLHGAYMDSQGNFIHSDLDTIDYAVSPLQTASPYPALFSNEWGADYPGGNAAEPIAGDTSSQLMELISSADTAASGIPTWGWFVGAIALFLLLQ